MEALEKRLAALSPEKKALLLKALAARKSSDKQPSDGPSPRPHPQEATRLTFAQQRLWFLDQFESGGATYNMPIAVELAGPLDVESLKRTLQLITERQEALRIRIFDEAGKPKQQSRDYLNLSLPVTDLSGSDREGINSVMRDEAAEPFRLAEDPLIRTKLLITGNESAILLITIHHIIADGWSIGKVLLKEFTEIYDAMVADRTPTLPALPIHYLDFAAWQETLLQGEKKTGLENYWTEKLGGLPALLELPTDRPRPAIQTHHGAVHHFTLTRLELDDLKAFAISARVTLFMVLLSGFALVLSRLARQEDFAIGTPTAGRDAPHTENLIGLFVNSLVMRVNADPALTIRGFLEQIKTTCLEAYEHQDMPFEYLVDELCPDRTTSFSPLFQVMMILQNQNTERSRLRAGPLELSSLPVDSATAMFDLTLKFEEQANELLGELEYNTDLFDKETIELLEAYLRSALSGMSGALDDRITDISLLDSADQRRPDARLISPCWPKRTGNLLDKVARQARSTPDHPAVRSAKDSFTYIELMNRCEDIAAELLGQGLVREQCVGVCMQRTPDLVAALLAVIRAGCAYVPIDPDYPRERIAAMIEQGELPLILTDDVSAEKLPKTDAASLNLDAPLSGRTTPVDWPSIHPQQLAYVIFTSGSTGQPKGVQITHDALMNFLDAMLSSPGLKATDRLAAVTTVSFDIAALELYLPLIAGATVELVDRETASDGFALLQRLSDCGATVMQATPATWRMLLATGCEALPIQKALCGGEALDSDLAGALSGAGLDLVNLYGPTETTIWSSLAHVRGRSVGANAELGTPINNTALYVLDESLNPCGIGLPGELYIGGTGVSRGYTRQPGLTSERFLPDIGSTTPGARMYRTGDLVVLRHDGRLDYLGRADFQVKIRGYRIELGEIESVLKSHPAIQHAVAVSRNTPSGQQLIGYVETRTGWQEHLPDQLQKPSNWQHVWDESYRQSTAEADGDDFSGWLSSITGEPMSHRKMQRWADTTAERILSASPRHVLEIGCGTGLIASRIIASLSHYTGVDFSPDAISKTRGRLAGLGHTQFTLIESAADSIPTEAPSQWDMVVINSVAQYFPSIDYLIEVIDRLSPCLAPNAIVFLGDLRHFALLDLLNSRILLAQPDTPLAGGEFKAQLKRARDTEQELLVTPGAFLGKHFGIDRPCSAEVLLKPSGLDPELGDFRFDLLLHLDTKTDAGHWSAALPRLPGPQTPGGVIDSLEAALAQHPRGFHMKGLPNNRLSATQHVLESLKHAENTENISELLKETSTEEHELDSLDQYLAWGEKENVQVRLNWDDDNGGSLQALVTPRDSDLPGTGFWVTENNSAGAVSNVPASASHETALRSQLDSLLGCALPDYMIPSALVVLEDLPLTPNGKVDRAALPEPEFTKSRETFVKPVTPLEQTIAQIWQDLLGISAISVTDHFFRLGGHSLLAVQVIARIREKTDVHVDLQSLFDAPVLRDLAAKLEGSSDQRSNIPALTPRSADQRDNAPVTDQQRQLWFLDQLHGPQSTYQISSTVSITGPLDQEALRQSLSLIVARHDSLRSNFQEGPSGPVRVTRTSPDFGWQYSELTEPADLEARIQETLAQTFDLANEPLLRCHLMKTGTARHVLVLIAHHIIADEWSIGILQQELARWYPEFSAGNRPSPHPLEFTYADYAIWHNECKNSEGYIESETFWRKTLRNPPPALDLAADFPRPVKQTESGAVFNGRIEGPLLQRVNALAAKTSTTLFMILLSAWAIVLSRRSGNPDLVVGVPVSDRSGEGVEELIGFFVNTLPFRIDLTGDPSAEELLEQVRRSSLNALQNQFVSFERIVELTNPDRSLAYTPIYQSVFVLQNAPKAPLGFGDLSLEVLQKDPGISKFDLTLSVEEQSDSLDCLIEYRTDLFLPETIGQMLREFSAVLDGVARSPTSPVSELPWMDADDRNQLMQRYGSELPRQGENDLLTRWHFRVAEQPDTPCVHHDNSVLSYGEIDHWAETVAKQLTDAGMKPGGVVAVHTEPTPLMVVSVLAILKVGCAFLPLLPDTPVDRRRQMLAAAQCSTVLDCVGGLDISGVLCVTPAPQPSVETMTTGRQGFAGALPAYIMFTSGSTGEPKPVVASRENLAAFITTRERFYSDPPCRLLLLQPFNFDVATGNLFWVLSSGGCVHLTPRTLSLDPNLLIREIEKDRITHLVLLPLLYEPLLSLARPEQLQSLDCVIVGGEQMPPGLPARHHAIAPGAMIFNEYGPTETTVMCAAHPADHNLQTGRHPIGRGVGQNSVYVLDQEFNLMPPGVSGELYIGGPHVTQGYLGRPGETAQAFLPDPFSRESGSRLYRSGDFAKLRGDGTIELLGRQDNQVKIRGNRIELDEVAHAIQRLKGVSEAVVRLDRQSPSARLAAYVVLKPNIEQSEPQIKAQLEKEIPNYMIPGSVTVLPSLPKTATGKIDDQALPEPNLSAHCASGPETETEEKMLAIWQKILGREKIGCEDNFFELGGDSILSIQLVSEARQQGVEVSASDLFEHQTIRAVSRIVGSSDRVESGENLEPQEFSLTPIQRWFIERNGEATNHFNQSLLLNISNTLTDTCIQSALEKLAVRHPMLRMRLTRSNRGHIIRYDETATVPYQIVNTPDPDEITRQASQLQKALSLSDGPMWQVCRFLVNDPNDRLLIIIHHMAVDGVSWRILLNDLDQLLRNPDLSLPTVSTGFGSWSQYLTSRDVPAEHVAYWMAAPPRKALPSSPDHTPPHTNEWGQERVFEQTIDVDLTQRLIGSAPARLNASTLDFLLTGLHSAIATWAGRDDIGITMESHGRLDGNTKLDLSSTVGWFTALYPVLLSAGRDAPLIERLRRHRDTLQRVPALGVDFGILRYLRDDPEINQVLAQSEHQSVSFNYLGQFRNGSDSDNEIILGEAPESTGREMVLRGERPHQIDINCYVSEDVLRLFWTYCPALHAPETISQIAGVMEQELLALCDLADGPALSRITTPTDFPSVDLSWTDLDTLHSRYDASVVAAYPMSPMQQAMLIQSQRNPQGGGYVVQFSCDLIGDLDETALQSAWQGTLEHHESLRGAAFTTHDDDLITVILSDVTLPWQQFDWASVPQSEQETKWVALLAQDRAAGFDETEPPMMRWTVIRLEDRRWRMLWSQHHVASDGWSLPIILSEVLDRYENLRQQIPHSPRPSPRYQDYIDWLATRVQDKEDTTAFWTSYLAGLRRPSHIGYFHNNELEEVFHSTRRSFPRNSSQRILEFVREQKTTLSALIEISIGVLIGHWTQQQDVVFGTTVSGRPAELAQVEKMVGMFINTLPVRLNWDGETTISALLAKHRENQISRLPHEHMPLSESIPLCGFRQRVQPFDFLCVFENYPVSDSLKEQTGSVHVENIEVYEQTDIPATLTIQPDEQITMLLSASSHFLEPDSATLFLDSLETILATAVEDGAQTIETWVAKAVPELTPRLQSLRPGRPDLDGLDDVTPVKLPFESPMGSTESTVAVHYCGILEIESPSRHDDFFELGGHSLLAARLASRLSSAFDFDLSVAAVFEYTTITAIAGFIDGQRWALRDENPDSETDEEFVF